MITFTNPHHTGLLPTFFSEGDPLSAKEQVHQAYTHGGGWNSFPGFTLCNWEKGPATIEYAGDPSMREMSRAKLRDETIILFESAWLAIVQPNGDFDIARVD